MKIRILLVSFLGLCFAACNDVVINSNTSDASKYTQTFNGGPNFQRVAPAIIGKCANCHYHQSWYTYSEADYDRLGLVVRGQVNSSPLYFRMSNSISGPGPKNMPQGGGQPFSPQELIDLEIWISGPLGG